MNVNVRIPQWVITLLLGVLAALIAALILYVSAHVHVCITWV
jgi:hypothetical protein